MKNKNLAYRRYLIDYLISYLEEETRDSLKGRVKEGDILAILLKKDLKILEKKEKKAKKGKGKK